jgi:protein-tyrosine-phosphatase
MFRENEGHKQSKMFTAVDYLPNSARKKLESSWAAVFYEEFFRRLDEQVFSVLYSENKSRPNTPVNILVGFETLKSGFGWSDEELYNHFLFDLQIRYALGLRDFDDGYFDLRTLYYFRAALVEYEREHGINLIQKASEQITDEQIRRFELKTGLQRMDSTQLQSNIRKMSRLQLLVEIIHRLYRILSAEEKGRYESLFDPYVAEDSLHYCYRVSRDEVEGRLRQIGSDLSRMLEALEAAHAEEEAFENARRVFGEQFRFEEDSIVVKTGKELSGSTLQSPDDPEATYRKKSGESARGYVANITETCDPENELQLVTAVSVQPNVTDDQKLLGNDVAGLSERTEIEEVITDAGYAGATAAEALDRHHVKQKTSAIKGRKKESDTIGLEEFEITRDGDGTITTLECPQGQSAEIRIGRTVGRYSAGFDGSECERCSLRDRCPAQRLKKRNVYVYRFNDSNVRVAEQRRQLVESGKEATNMRASVESTVRSIIHPFGGHLCKMPVRGIARVTTMAVLSGAMVNVRRITSYLFPKGPTEGPLQPVFT